MDNLTQPSVLMLKNAIAELKVDGSRATKCVVESEQIAPGYSKSTLTLTWVVPDGGKSRPDVVEVEHSPPCCPLNLNRSR